MKYSAEALSKAGDAFLGRSYDEMDCQEFVERSLESIGLRIDLKGSNAWFREMSWVGSPEECVKVFGSVPKGAFLFIWADDGGEERRGYHDGLGNASHIGIKTGRGKGAIHSSSSQGCVAESEFHDRTIRNGGWNRVGLWERMDYGTMVNWHLEHGCQAVEEEKSMQGTVFSENGLPVNVRKGPGKREPLVDRLPVGTSLEITGKSGDWYKVSGGGLKGWIMKEFVRMGEVPEEMESGSYIVTISGLDLTQAQAICNNYPGRSVMEVAKG